MNKFAQHYIACFQKCGGALSALKNILTSQVTHTAAGAAGAVGAAHYGAGLDWQDSAPWAIAGAGLGNKNFRDWAVAKEIAGPTRFNTATNRILGSVAVKGGVPVALSMARHVPPTLEALRGASENINQVTGEAAKGNLGASLANSGKNLDNATALTASVANSADDIAKNLKRQGNADPLGIKPVANSVDRAASGVESLAGVGRTLADQTGQGIQFLKDHSKPIGYGAAAVGGGLVLAKLIDSIAKLKNQPISPDRKKQPVVA